MAEEISFKSVGQMAGDPDLLKEAQQRPYGIRTPLVLGHGNSGIFQMHFNPVAQAEDNLKNLILTNHGERLGNYFYGANLRSLTNELAAQEDFDAQAMMRISDAVSRYMAFIELDTFSSDFRPSATPGPDGGVAPGITKIEMLVKYNIPSLRVANRSLSVSIYCSG